MIRLTIELADKPGTDGLWTAFCAELGVTTTARSPERALEGLAVSVRAVVESCLAPGKTGIGVLHEIVAGAAALAALPGKQG